MPSHRLTNESRLRQPACVSAGRLTQPGAPQIWQCGTGGSTRTAGNSHDGLPTGGHLTTQRAGVSSNSPESGRGETVVMGRGRLVRELHLRCRSLRLLPRRGVVVRARSSVQPWRLRRCPLPADRWPPSARVAARYRAPGTPRRRSPGGRVRLRCRPYAPCGSSVTSITDGRYVGWSGADEVPEKRSSTSFGRTVTVAALRGGWYIPTGHRG
jgi:hypothetical protein